MAIIFMVGLASCQIGKKPVRRNVSVDKYEIKQKYGLTTVDTTGGKPGDSTGGLAVSNNQKKGLIATLLDLSQREIPFNTFSGKAKMHYVAGGDKQEFVAHIRIQKDKVIWVNVTALSGVVAVARVYITPDSILLVNFLQKEAHKLQIKDVSKLLPVSVDFSTLQNLIIGNVLKKGTNAIDAADFGGTWTLNLQDGEMSQQLGFNKADSSIRTMQMRTADNSTEGMMQYGAYEMADNRRFSTQRVVTISNKGESHYIDMNFNKVEFDQPVEFPFSIPKNYTIK